MVPGAGIGWESALLLPVPAAESAVGEHRARLDGAARDGIPAHITVLYPFLPPGQITARLLTVLGELFAGVSAFGFTLDRIGWFGDDIVWLGPCSPVPFVALTDLVFAEFPGCPPYGGQFSEVVPHLTIGYLGTLRDLRAAANSVRPHLPIQAEATRVVLMAGPRPGTPGALPGQWRTAATFPLG